jgi:hypothetical protein
VILQGVSPLLSDYCHPLEEQEDGYRQIFASALVSSLSKLIG